MAHGFAFQGGNFIGIKRPRSANPGGRMISKRTSTSLLLLVVWHTIVILRIVVCCVCVRVLLTVAIVVSAAIRALIVAVHQVSQACTSIHPIFHVLVASGVLEMQHVAKNGSVAQYPYSRRRGFWVFVGCVVLRIHTYCTINSKNTVSTEPSL